MFSVTDTSGNKIEGDIFLTQLTFYNSGSTKIEMDDFREEPGIQINNGSGFFQSRIIEQDDDKISQFRNYNFFNADSTWVLSALRWSRLDPQSYAKMEVIYSGDEKTKPYMHGSSSLINYRHAPKDRYSDLADSSSIIDRGLGQLLFFSPLILLIALNYLLFKSLIGVNFYLKNKSKISNNIHDIAMTAIFILLITISLKGCGMSFDGFQWLMSRPITSP